MKTYFKLMALLCCCFSIFFVGCSGNGVIKDWTEVYSIHGVNGTLTQSKIHLVTYDDECSYEEWVDKDSDKYEMPQVDIDMYKDKEKSIKEAEEFLYKIYYTPHPDSFAVVDQKYYRKKIIGFYTEVMEIKLYVNNYIEVRKKYEYYGQIATYDYYGEIVTELKKQNKTNLTGIYLDNYSQLSIEYFEQ